MVDRYDGRDRQIAPIKSNAFRRALIRNFVGFNLLIPLTWSFWMRALDREAPVTFTQRIRFSAIEQLYYNLAAHLER